jgi:excisionase family DNA binding protein
MTLARFPTNLDELPDVLTAPEVARILRLGRNTVYEYLRTGAIPSIRIGRRLLIPKAAVQRLLESAAGGG